MIDTFSQINIENDEGKMLLTAIALITNDRYGKNANKEDFINVADQVIRITKKVHDPLKKAK